MDFIKPGQNLIENYNPLVYNSLEMSLWYYLRKFFNSNYFTLIFVVTLFLLTFIKYLKIPKLRSARFMLITVIVLGVALRVAWLLFSSHTPQFSWNPKHMLENDLINIHAIDLTKGIWFVDELGAPSARRPIGYPMFLGLLYKVFGIHLWVARISNLALFAASVLLIYQIAKLLFSERVGLLAAFLFSIYPTSIYSIALITDEHLFLPLWYLGLYLLLREVRGRRVRYALFWYGLVFGYATMIRTHSIFMPFVVAFAYLLMKNSWKRIVTAFLVVLCVMQLINLPWVIRNYKVWRVPVLYTATGGFIYSHLNSYATPEGGGHIPVKGEPGYSEALDQAEKEGNGALAHVISNREMTRWILTHPKKFAVLGTERLLVFMGWNRVGMWPIWYQFYEGSYDPARPVSSAEKHVFEEAAYAFYYVILFSFIGAVITFWRQRKNIPEASKAGILTIGACFLFWFFEQMVIFPDRKYRFPLEPLMIVAACAFFDYLIFHFRWENFLKNDVKHAA